MPAELTNSAIADALEELGDLNELDGALNYRVLAYRSGARAVREASVSVAALAREGRATEISGIGKTLQEKILALLETGTIPAAEKLRARIPPGLIAVTRVPSLGPKRARLLHSELGVDSLVALRDAAVAQRLREVRGLGAKFEQNVLAALERLPKDEQGNPILRSPDAVSIEEELAQLQEELERDPRERAAAGLPRLIELSDIRGDLHCHTLASDGRNTIEEMALAARARGYEYLAITDHSASHGFGNDVSPAQLLRQIERVRAANEAIDGIELLAGSEVNILPDGSLDYDDSLLAQLDWVVASVHTAFGSSEQAMTERMIAAVEHPYVDAIGHPTGRLIGRREPYALDVQAVIEAAARAGTMLEINANPNRRDLNDVHARAAAEAGAMIVIDSDAHGVERLDVMRWGVATARRAWLGAADVANTRPWPQFAALRKRERAQPRRRSRGKSSSATSRSQLSRRKGSSAPAARCE
jgi:histidinol phosphatase-like PHP family hydrolase